MASHEQTRPPMRFLRAAAASVLFLCASGQVLADETVDIVAAPTAYTGARFTAFANVSDPGSVVLYEWDFQSDGVVDFNRTGDPSASFVYTEDGRSFTVTLNVTRTLNSTLNVTTATWDVQILNGTPAVTIDLPDRVVAGVPLTFVARATDPDASPGGEPFSFRWFLDGAVVGGGGAAAELTAEAPGPHEVGVEVTDAEGLTSRSSVQLDFQPRGLFEGKAGFATLSLVIALAALLLGLPLVRMQRRERRARRAAAAKRAEEDAVKATRRKGPPGKAPFAGASGGGSGARISAGGAPAALQKTRECPVCHNAVDADNPDCPYCGANGEADAFEARLAEVQFAQADLSEVRAILQRARRERHLGRLDRHRELLAAAGDEAEARAEDATQAGEWLGRAREALARAERTSPAGGERLERASSYLKLAESLAGAKQNGKAARHAKRAFEILEAAGTPPGPAGPRSPAIGALEESGGRSSEAVKAEIASVRAGVKSMGATLDEGALQLVAAADDFERRAEWAQALEVLRALREKLDRASKGASEATGGADVAPHGPPGK